MAPRRSLSTKTAACSVTTAAPALPQTSLGAEGKACFRTAAEPSGAWLLVSETGLAAGWGSVRSPQVNRYQIPAPHCAASCPGDKVELGAGQHHWPPCFRHLRSPGCRERGEGGYHHHAASPPGPFTPCVTPGSPIPTPARVRLQPTARPPFPETQCQCPAHGSFLPQDGLVSPGGLAQSGSGQRRRPSPQAPRVQCLEPPAAMQVCGQGLPVAASLTASTLDSCLLPLPSRALPSQPWRSRYHPTEQGSSRQPPAPRLCCREHNPAAGSEEPVPATGPARASATDPISRGASHLRQLQGRGWAGTSMLPVATGDQPWAGELRAPSGFPVSLGTSGWGFCSLESWVSFPTHTSDRARLSLHTALTARSLVPGLSAEPGLTC